MAQMRKMMVSCDGLFRAEAYVDASDDWNGWLRPYFTFDEARRVLDECVDSECSDVDSWHYDAAFDWIFYHDGMVDAEDVARGMTVETEDGAFVLYPVGAGIWTWDADE